MEKTKTMSRIARNHTGNAALCAILIMIMLLAIGTAVLVVTGRSSIDENQSMPTVTFSQEDSSEEETSSVEEAIPEEPKALVEYPEKDFDFMDMTLEDVTAGHSVILDCENNKLYTGHAWDEKAYPASLTKIMTIIVALENTEDIHATYTFTAADIKSLSDENASVAGFEEGETVTVEDLLYGAMLPSGADATLGLANYVAGSEAEFVKLMNAKAEEMGLKGTHFTNASGLHDEDHYSTAQDLAMITRYGLTAEGIKDEFAKIISAKEYTTSETEQHEEGIYLDSIFFARYEGYYIDRDMDGEADTEIFGGKTGFTDESGFSLASVYRVDGIYYVCVTLDSETTGYATEDNVMIAERYLPTYDLITPSNADEDSSAADSSSVVDVTPAPIDQTESTELQEDSSVADNSSEESTDTQTEGE